jgi:hypothetical protein
MRRGIHHLLELITIPLGLNRFLHHDGRLGQYTGLFAYPAPDAFFFMYDRFHDGVLAGAGVLPWFNGDCLVNQGALAVADFAA